MGGDEGTRLAGEGVGRPMGRCRFSAQGTTMRFATPMIDGVITSTLMEPIVYPAIFFLWRSRRLSAKRKALVDSPHSRRGLNEIHDHKPSAIAL